MAEIKEVRAREILDSRGTPTIEAEVVLSSGVIGRACVPSGASTGQHEAVELRDGGTRYRGKGVLKAVHNVEHEIRDAVLGHDVRHQKGIDEILIRLDDTPNKSRLGANAILSVSMAVARAASLAVNVPLYQYLHQGHTGSWQLPVPLMNIINGGAHADNTLDIQEFMIVPVGAPTFKEAVRYGVEVFQTLKTILKQKKLNTAVGDEGGFAPDLPSNEAAIELILTAIESAGFKAGKDIYLALDLASNELLEDNRYHLKSENRSFSVEEWVAYLAQWVNRYPLISLEDAMGEEDWSGWKLLTESLGSRVQIVGDDIFVTNTKLLLRGIHENVANSVLIKPNQIGTLTETCQTLHLAKESKYTTIISHRSGETGDDFIADLSVATEAGQIKTGSLCRSDRVGKYNQLMRIEEQLGASAQYAGLSPFIGKESLRT